MLQKSRQSQQTLACNAFSQKIIFLLFLAELEDGDGKGTFGTILPMGWSELMGELTWRERYR